MHYTCKKECNMHVSCHLTKIKEAQSFIERVKNYLSTAMTTMVFTDAQTDTP